MADTRLLSNAKLVINNKAIQYEPNSLVIRAGRANRMVHAVTTGGGNVQVVSGEDISTKKGYCKFTIRPTAEMIKELKGWQNNGDANAIDVIQDDYSASIQYASVITDPDLSLGADTTVDVEFEGMPAV